MESAGALHFEDFRCIVMPTCTGYRCRYTTGHLLDLLEHRLVPRLCLSMQGSMECSTYWEQFVCFPILIVSLLPRSFPHHEFYCFYGCSKLLFLSFARLLHASQGCSVSSQCVSFPSQCDHSLPACSCVLLPFLGYSFPSCFRGLPLSNLLFLGRSALITPPQLRCVAPSSPGCPLHSCHSFLWPGFPYDPTNLCPP